MGTGPGPNTSPNGDSGDYSALEAFLVENPELERLASLSVGFNLFEAIGTVRREERHSDFLAFLLDPSAPHGFSTAILRAFVDGVLATGTEGRRPPVTRADVALMDLQKAKVEREWESIDLLIHSDADDFVLLIENKIDSVEHSNQLARYLAVARQRFPSQRILPVYLTPEWDEPSNESYSRAGYDLVKTVVERELSSRLTSISQDVQVVVRHYLEMLERHIMPDSEIGQLARRIYEKHSRALEILFEYRPDEQQSLMQKTAELIAEDQSARLVYNTKSYIHFVPKAWDQIDYLKACFARSESEPGDRSETEPPPAERQSYNVVGFLLN